jgi:hypothetical protein
MADCQSIDNMRHQTLSIRVQKPTIITINYIITTENLACIAELCKVQ